MALLAAVFAWYAWSWFAARSEHQQARAEVVRLTNEAVEAQPVDTGLLSHLMARIAKFEDHTHAPDLLEAQARIELVRGRAERAHELFGAVGSQPEATEDQRRLLARILLRRHEAGSTDGSTAMGWLRDGAARALAIAERSDEPRDWFLAWQAHVRLDQAEVVTRCRERLLALDPQSRQTRLTVAAAEFRPEEPAVVFALRGEFEDVPVELAAMVAMGQLQAGENAAALSEVQALLGRAPGVLGVRLCAALVFHVCVLGSQDEAEKQRWRPRRNVQLDWLLANAPADDPRRQNWSEWRSQ